uniref:Uncharacterized protein n=1 Tax=Tetranychus urticae TaxID=32264 RepID=T1KVP0_TETUR
MDISFPLIFYCLVKEEGSNCRQGHVKCQEGQSNCYL